jgi:hypothetical protein
MHIVALLGASQPPCPQRQSLQVQHLRLNVPKECGQAEEHTQNVHCVISVVDHLARSAPILAHLLVGLDGAREDISYQRAFQICLPSRARMARCHCERIHELQDKDPGKGSSEVANTKVAHVSFDSQSRHQRGSTLTSQAESCRCLR